MKKRFDIDTFRHDRYKTDIYEMRHINSWGTNTCYDDPIYCPRSKSEHHYSKTLSLILIAMGLIIRPLSIHIHSIANLPKKSPQNSLSVLITFNYRCYLLNLVWPFDFAAVRELLMALPQASNFLHTVGHATIGVCISENCEHKYLMPRLIPPSTNILN